MVVLEDRVIGAAGNRTIGDCDPTAHAEIVALRSAASAVGNYRLSGAALYVTIEPCAMCAGALVQARIARLVYGADDAKGGAVRTCLQVLDVGALNHRVAVTSGILAGEAIALLQSFFAARQVRRTPSTKNNDVIPRSRFRRGIFGSSGPGSPAGDFGGAGVSLVLTPKGRRSLGEDGVKSPAGRRRHETCGQIYRLISVEGIL